MKKVKHKSHSHKNENAFKFETFNEKLNNINITSLQNLKRRLTEANVNVDQTFFSTTLEKWMDLNCTNDFRQLRHKIGPSVEHQNLPQIIHRKRFLVETLLSETRADNQALDVILELIVALARDLQSEFYEYFPAIFERLVRLSLQNVNPEIIEMIFVCQTFLFKYLSKFILKDIEANFQVFKLGLVSRKEYIVNFTSETFAFLLKKTKDPEELSKIFEMLSQNVDLSHAISRIWFETIKGINGKLHHKSDLYLRIGFEKFENFTILKGFIETCLENLDRESFSPIWKYLIANLNPDSEIIPENIIKLIHHIVSRSKYKKHVEESFKLASDFIEYLYRRNVDSVQTQKLLLETIEKLFLYRHEDLPSDKMKPLCEKLFDYMENVCCSDEFVEFVLDFLTNILPSPLYDKVIYKYVCGFFVKALFCQKSSNLPMSNGFRSILKLMTSIVQQKAYRPFFGGEIQKLSKYTLDFDDTSLETKNNETVADFICELIMKKESQLERDCLIILSNMPFASKLYKFVATNILSHFIRKKEDDNLEIDPAILLELVIFFILQKSDNSPITEIDISIFIGYLCTNPYCIESLQALDYMLAYNKNKLTGFRDLLHDKIPELFPILRKNLSYPNKMNRIVASHILTLFESKLETTSNEVNPDGSTIFRIFLQAELTPSDLMNYRERLRFLRKLDYNFLPYYLPKPINGIDFDLVPVDFLLGTLYENLSLLWEPILEVLETYARSNVISYQNRFIENLFNHYKETIQRCHSDIKESQSGGKSDSLNHQILLLKCFKRFPALIEKRNREFVEHFLRFLDEDFKFKSVFSENITKEVAEMKEDIDDPAISIKKTLWNTFFAYLEVFEMFKNPKAMYKEAELEKLFTNLLSSPNSTAQRHGFNCLLTYHDTLRKYKENFLKLIDDKSFSSEIHSFMKRDNAEDNVILEKDRINIVQPFFRILVGKMISSSGTKTHGKSKADYKRSLIFQVLSSFDENEKIMFLELIYSSVNVEKSWMVEDYNRAKDLIDLKCFIPIKHFQSLITTLEFAMKHLGNTSVPIMRYLLKVLLACSALCSHLLEPQTRPIIKDYIVEMLKNFRTHCYKVAEYFFTHFNTYPFESTEIDSMFRSLVQPLITNLHLESKDRPSPLLRLFKIWTENPRYFVLLVKRIPTGNEDITPIASMIKLYSDPKISPTTYLFITGLIENLLIAEEEEEEKESALKIQIGDHDLPTPEKERVNFGTLILIPYLKNIIERIKLNNLVKKNQYFAFTLQEINILARLSVHVTDAEDSKTIMVLMLQSISRKKRPEEDKEIFILKILTHLSNNLSPESLAEILNLANDLFVLIERPASRRQLCNFLLNLAKKNQQFQPMAQLICDLNSYNVRFPEEPDYDLRISAFKEVASYLETLKNSGQFFQYPHLESLRLLIWNCSFFMNFYDDLSLRELSAKTILKTCQSFADSSQDLFNKYVVELVLFQVVSKGISNPKESASNEFINLLVELIQAYPSRNIFIDQLRSLCSDDEETDFWQNIKHIQLHRRTRAMNRLMQNKEQLSSISSRVHMNFLIPIIKNFIAQSLLPNTQQNNARLLQTSVDCLATLLQYCPWQKYDKTLSYYVQALLNNKIEAKVAIKIISSLLEKFSFLKPEQVSLIEKNLIQDDFDKIKTEYSFEDHPSRGRVNNNKKKKKKPQEKQETDADKVDDKKEPSGLDMDPEDKIETGLSEQDFKHFKNIYESLCKKLLPLMHRCLHHRSETDCVHDSNKQEFSEDEDVQKIPIALAIVKLLKYVQLDSRLFQINLNSIVLRLCQFLQSKAYSIREMARKTLARILEILGPKYFPQIFDEMKTLLDRGYRKHVLVYTTFVLLQRLLPQLNTGDLDRCMFDLIDVCHQELFGSLAEEKEVSKIVSKTKEATKIKSYDIYELMARFVSESMMKKMTNPLETIMNENSDHKTLAKIEKVFHNIGRGLVQNKHVRVEFLIEFLNEIFAKTVPKDDQNEPKNNDENGETAKVLRRADSLIIPTKSLRRVNPVSKVNRLSYQHILSNFALECYLHVLKNYKCAQIQSHQEILDQSLVYLKQFLKSNDPNVVTAALNCILILLNKYSKILSFENHSNEIISQIFLLLQKHSGLNNDGNRLIILCFKTIAYFINTRLECKLTDEQIRILLSYAEYDFENNSKNVAIYFLLKSIIARRFVCKELHSLMERLMDLAITTEIDSVRDHTIDLYVKYITDYPIDPNRLKGKLLRLARQLEVKWLAGRKAAIIMLKLIIKNLSCDVIEPVKKHLFVVMSSALVNEDSTECANGLDEAILQLFGKLSSEELDELFESFVLSWLKSDTHSIQAMSSNLLGLFVEHEKSDFEKRIPICLPYISERLAPGKFKSLSPTFKNEQQINDEDNLLFGHLHFVSKLLKLDNILQIMSKKKLKEYFNEIFTNIIGSFLLYPHTWIRNICAEIIGCLFSSYDPELLVRKSPQYSGHYLSENVEEKMVQLARKFCLIYRDIYSCPFICGQLIKNLVYIARVFIVLDDRGPESNLEEQPKRYSLGWLIKKMNFETKFEIQYKPKETLKRIVFTKWIAAVSFKLGSEKILKYLPLFLPIICREELTGSGLNDAKPTADADDGLKNLTKQFLQMIRKMIGSERFADLYNDVRNQISRKKLERRKHRAVQMVVNGISGIKRKQAKHRRLQQNSKRRKIVSSSSSKANHFTVSSIL